MTDSYEETIIDIPSSRRGSCQDQAPSTTTTTHEPREDAQRQGKMMAAPKTKEYIKMIHLILSKLAKRKRPPPPLLTDYLHYTQPGETTPLLWDHDDTIDLIIKLRSVLIICENTGLSILDQRGRGVYTSPVTSRSSSPVRPESSTHSPNTASPQQQQQQQRQPQQRSEFDTILQLVQDLLSHDCRYIGLHPKPSRPPFTLQILVLDLVVLLIQAREDIPSLYKVGMTLLPAFEIFPDITLKVKLLSFFIDILLPKLMQTPHVAKDSSSRNERLPTQGNHDTGVLPPSRHPGTTPIINVQSPEGQETKMDSPRSTPVNKSSHLTIDTLTASSSPSASSSLLSPVATHHSSDTTHPMISLIEPIQQYALFTPLLTFMIQYLDPYLDAQQIAAEDLPSTFPNKTHSIFNFHKALRFMIQHKPDLYLDILQIIAYSMDDVKFRACQVLFHYYFVSLGHLVIAEPLPKLGVTDEIATLDKIRLVQQQRAMGFSHGSGGYQDLPTSSSSSDLPTLHTTGINRKYDPAALRRGAADDDEGPMDEEHEANNHVWYPHMFTASATPSRESSTSSLSTAPVHPSHDDTYCSGCNTLISGFGLRCYQCKRSVHYQCYNYCLTNDDLDIMLYVKEGGIQKVVSPQFCHVPIQPRFADITAGHEYQWDKSNRSPKVHLLGHQFHLVNLYTLLLCACCRMPLFGISQQGYRCSICNRFVHPACLDKSEHEGGFHHPLSTVQDCQPYRPLLESDTRISSQELSTSLVRFYGDMVPITREDMVGRSYEEVGTMLSVLVLQENILRYGISAGCLLVDYVPSNNDDDPLLSQAQTSSDDPACGRQDSDFSRCSLLRRAIELCSHHINSNDCQASSFLADFRNNREWSQTAYECLLSREDYLAHIGTMMKSLTSSIDTTTTTNDASKDLLQVTPFTTTQHRLSPSQDSSSSSSSDAIQPPSDIQPATNSILDRDTLLSWTMDNLYIKSRKAGEILLQQMRNLGLFERYDASPILFTVDRWTRMDTSTHDCQTLCIFPVPYAIDCSPHVETLINAVDSCLNDIDIAINECGMLLLTRRCWPDPFMSPYTCERLMVAILRWILLEDEKLTALYAAFTISNTIQLPGVKQNRWTQTAQSALLSRMNYGQGEAKQQQQGFVYGAGVSSGAGNVYVTTRNMLRDRYLTTWMSTLHAIDPASYATLLEDAIDEVVESVMDDTSISELGHASVSRDKKSATLQRFDIYMGYLVKLKSLGLTFSSLNTILESQLDQAIVDFERLHILEERRPIEIRALAKLFATKTSTSKPYGQPSLAGDATSPFDMISSMILGEDGQWVDRGIQWLSLIVHLGTGIPSVSLAKIARALVQAQASISTTADFIKLVWFQVVNGLNVVTSHAVITDIIGYLNETALESLKSKNQSEPLSIQRLTSAQTFIRYSAALTCYAYGCPLANISDFDIVPYFADHISQSHSKQSLQMDRTPPMQADDTTPIIRCMLYYLQLDQLNVREIVLKMFYAMIYWGAGISNKSDFTAKCIPSLFPTIWELLPPSHDGISDINLNLLMKLMNTNATTFHSCAYKVMEDPSWEIRYQGLDSLYGLFTKMDVAFQTKWLSLLSHLGPVFSTFIACLWDKDENVRSKALALIRTFGMLHLRSAFRCWEAYFLTATDQQRRPLVNLMIQLNALFPDWQVLQWESLLEALEAKLPDTKDILEQYARPSMSTKTSGGLIKKPLVKNDDDDDDDDDATIEDEQRQENVESKNTKVLMMTLALQMLSNHLSIDLVQISRLKLLVVVHMGFEECQRYNASGEWVVNFGTMHIPENDPMSSAMLTACTRGLKKVMDSFSPLPAETVATMAPDVLERNKLKLAENSSPGVHFIDVALKLFTSGIDLTQLNQVVLRSWLEIILIVVYKHNILDRTYEHSIVTCMKQIIDLITKDIGEENKLLILEILKCLLRQSDHLTAMVLSKQILALGKLMTKCGKRTTEPVFLKAKQFLKSAFLRFAVAGLFVLIFKNQTVSNANTNDVDLFYVLRTVIDPEDVVPDEDVNHAVYLLDQPVRDVLDKLLKQQMDRKSFSTVLHNMSRYVETVHSHPYPEPVLNDYADFLNHIVKYTADWRRSDWDVNSLFTMSSLLLLEHPYHFQILLPSIQVLFRHGIRHCNVLAECIVNLMAAFSTIATIPGTPPENVFVETIIEEIRMGLTVKQKIHKDTLLTLLQLVLWDCDERYGQWYTAIENTYIGELPSGRRRQPYFAKKVTGLLDPLVNFLKSSSNTDQFTKKDFKAYSTASHILMWMCSKDKNNIYRLLHMLKLDETSHCLQFLNWFTLCLLKNQCDSLLETMEDTQEILTELLVQIFNSIHINFDRPDPGFSSTASGEALTLCFLILKTWTLLHLRTLHTSAILGVTTNQTKPSLWLSVWPSMDRLLCSIDPATLIMMGNVGASIWSMFLSLLQFLHMCRSEAVMTHAFDWCNILDYIIYQMSTILTNHSKPEKKDSLGDDDDDDDDEENAITQLSELLQQAERVRKMFAIPPIEVPAITLIDHLYLELKEIMRLQSAASSYQNQWNSAAASSSGFSL